jgi:hypothetical protein
MDQVNTTDFGSVNQGSKPCRQLKTPIGSAVFVFELGVIDLRRLDLYDAV